LDQIESELPAFVYFLVNEFEIPENLQSSRFGITHYHNPTLAESITQLSAERHLLQLIDEYIFGVPGTDEWKGTCSDLLSRLMKSAANPAELKYFTTKNIGENLKKLEKSLAPSVKGRIKSKTSRGRTVYTIKPLVVR
jgi:predicted MPP superfamily phosphohydrolase